jgi:LPS export ABC transporter protein LptC
MRNLKRVLFSLLLIFIIVEVIFIFPKKLETANTVVDSNTLSQEKEKAEQKMDGVHLVEAQKGNRDWELFAEKARGYQGEGDWFLKKVKVQFYNQNRIDFVVTGEEGEIDGKTRNIKVKGKVVTKSNNGYTFYTEELFYHSAQRKIISPGKLKMTGPNDEQGEGLVLDGYNMHVLVDSSEMKIFKDVQANKKLKDQQNLKIQSESALFSGLNKEAHFENNVTLLYNQMVIEGPDCFFNYSADMKTLEFIRLKGGVSAKDKKRRAVSQELEVNLRNNMFKFNGNPKIYQDDDEIKGEEILFLDGGKKIKIQKVKASGQI